MALAAQRRGQMSRGPETCQVQHQATKRWPDPDLGRQDTPHNRPTSVHALGTGQPLLTPLLYQALLWRWGRDRPCAQQKSRLCISQSGEAPWWRLCTQTHTQRGEEAAQLPARGSPTGQPHRQVPGTV